VASRCSPPARPGGFGEKEVRFSVIPGRGFRAPDEYSRVEIPVTSVNFKNDSRIHAPVMLPS